MKAEEIRESVTYIEYADEAQGPAVRAMNDCACFLREIAAQLADLNEHLKLVDESVFGAKK